MTRRGAPIAGLIMAGAVACLAAAQTAGGISLSSVTGLKCAFTLYATGSWVGGDVRADVKPAKLFIQFDDISTDESTARTNIGFGPIEIIVRLSRGHLHFLHVDNAGPLYVTTVLDKETRAGRVQAVHTRHEYTDVSLPGFTSRPEQYYGDCEIIR